MGCSTVPQSVADLGGVAWGELMGSSPVTGYFLNSTNPRLYLSFTYIFLYFIIFTNEAFNSKLSIFEMTRTGILMLGVVHHAKNEFEQLSKDFEVQVSSVLTRLLIFRFWVYSNNNSSKSQKVHANNSSTTAGKENIIMLWRSREHTIPQMYLPTPFRSHP